MTEALFEWNCDGNNAKEFAKQCVNPYIKRIYEAEITMVQGLEDEMQSEVDAMVAVFKLVKRHIELQSTDANTKIVQLMNEQIERMVATNNETKTAISNSTDILSSLLSNGSFMWHNAGGTYFTTLIAVVAMLLSLFNTTVLFHQIRTRHSSVSRINFYQQPTCPQVPTTYSDE